MTVKTGWGAATPAEAVGAIAAELRRTAGSHGRTAVEWPGDAPALTSAQEEAVTLARRALARFGGVLVADGVGTGKSLVALRLIVEARARGERVLLVAPAGLLPGWRRQLGSLAPDVDRLSHTRLSRDDAVVAQVPPPGLVVVDEAHAFRNPATRRYRVLARFTTAARTLLLSATPVNNSLLDLYFLLRLFLRDGAFAGLGVRSLVEAFRDAVTALRTPGRVDMEAFTGTQLPVGLREALGQVVIRRGRARFPQGDLRFPRRSAPVLVRYQSDGALEKALELLSDLEFAAFVGERTEAPCELLRLNLLKRLESGIASFASSLAQLRRVCVASQAALACGRWIRPGQGAAGTGDAAVQLSFVELVAQPLPPHVDPETRRRAVARDLKRIESLRALADQLGANDAKLATLVALLEGPLAGRRILLFTEFRETAAALWRALRRQGGIGRIDGGGAWLGAARAGRQEVVRRFAPHANGAPPPPAAEEIRLLIATDVLSEGLNLQDADTVISYDLPWNPVRLIQRVGRIDRLGSSHDRIDIYNFMPDREIDALLALVARIRSKLQAIRAGVGADGATVLDDVPDAGFIERLARGDAEMLDPPDADGPPGPSETAMHPLYDAIPRCDSVFSGEGVPVAHLGGEGPLRAVLVVAARGGVAAFVATESGARIDSATLVGLVRAAGEAPARRAPLSPHAVGELNAVLEAWQEHARPRPPRARCTAGRAIVRIMRWAGQRGIQPAAVRLADRLVQRLSAGLTAAEEDAVRAWLSDRDPARSAALALAALAARLGPPPEQAAGAPVAAFLVGESRLRSYRSP